MTKEKKTSDAASSEVNVKTEKAADDIADIEDIDIFDTENNRNPGRSLSAVKNTINLEMIKRTFDSVKR